MRKVDGTALKILENFIRINILKVFKNWKVILLKTRDKLSNCRKSETFMIR